MSKIIDPYCEGCYYCGSAGGLHTCDYIFIADRRRPCPAGAGCTVRITRKEMLMGALSWDVDAGYKMWLDGSSDKEISKALHIAISTVSYRRRKYWEKIPRVGGEAVAAPDTSAGKEDEPMLTPKTAVSNAPAQIGVFEAMESATKDMVGIHAICTADAIRCLWGWKDVKDLQAARDSIDYLIQRLGEENAAR